MKRTDDERPAEHPDGDPIPDDGTEEREDKALRPRDALLWEELLS